MILIFFAAFSFSKIYLSYKLSKLTDVSYKIEDFSESDFFCEEDKDCMTQAISTGDIGCKYIAVNKKAYKKSLGCLTGIMIHAVCENNKCVVKND